VIDDPAAQRAVTPRLPPADDFHQCGSRLQCLLRAGLPVCLVTVSHGETIVAAALLERTGDRWFLWKGPSGGPASPALLARMLDGIAARTPATIVLMPEWADPGTLHGAGFQADGWFSTLLVPTTGGDAAILGRMKDAARRRVQRAIAAGLRFVADRAMLPEFYPVYAEAMRAAGSPDFASLDELTRLLEAPRAHLFLAMLGDEIAAGAICFQHRDALEARYVATRRGHRWLGPLNFVHFKSVQRAAQLGIGHYDLSGLAVGEVDDKLVQINRFKTGFGGVRMDYPIYRKDQQVTTGREDAR
jgi:hypothetical protein